MKPYIITVYCLIDEYLKLVGIKDDVKAEISNAEMLIIGVYSRDDFNGNYYKQSPLIIQRVTTEFEKNSTLS